MTDEEQAERFATEAIEKVKNGIDLHDFLKGAYLTWLDCCRNAYKLGEKVETDVDKDHIGTYVGG